MTNNKQIKSYSFTYELHDEVSQQIQSNCLATFNGSSKAQALHQFYKDKSIIAQHIIECNYLHDYTELTPKEVEAMEYDEIIGEFNQLRFGAIYIKILK